jgi:hypothetical protein
LYANIVQRFRKGKSKKVVVFENGQETQIENNAQPKPKFTFPFLSTFFYFDACEITQKGGEEQ